MSTTKVKENPVRLLPGLKSFPMKTAIDPNEVAKLTIAQIERKISYYQIMRDHSSRIFNFYVKQRQAMSQCTMDPDAVESHEENLYQRRTEYYAAMSLRWEAKLTIRKSLLQNEN